MTLTETEKRFYKAFDIEPMYIDVYIKEAYPPITDHVFLELICIAFNQVQNIEIYRILTVESLKELILQKLIIFKKDVYREVRKIMGVE